MKSFHKEYAKHTEISLKEMIKSLGQIENDLNRNIVRTENGKIEITNSDRNTLISLLNKKEIKTNYTEILETRYSNDYDKTEEDKQEDIIFYDKELQKEALREENNKNIIANYRPKKNIKCTRCGGSGKVNFSYANGICFKCMGTGLI